MKFTDLNIQPSVSLVCGHKRFTLHCDACIAAYCYGDIAPVTVYVQGKGPCLYDSPIYYRATVLQDGTTRINSRVWPQDSDYSTAKNEAN